MKVFQSINKVKVQRTTLTCFKAYDVRGELGVNFDSQIAYLIGRAVVQYFQAKDIIIGFDARETSPELAAAMSLSLVNQGGHFNVIVRSIF